jgi:hypothetical protein
MLNVMENVMETFDPFAKKPTNGQIAGLIVLSLAGLAGLRLLAARKINGAERLAEALLDTEKLHEAQRGLPEASETVLAACAAYVVNVAYRAAEGQGVAGVMEDPIGHSRTHRHPYTHAVTTVLTESHAPDHLLTYAVTVPELGEVRGTRRVGSLRVTGLSPARPAPDTVQITLTHDYTAQAETEFEIADYLVTGRTRLFGSATLRDNRGNVGRINIGFDGTVTGTVTREARVVGRFEGKVSTGVTFKTYDIPPADTTPPTAPVDAATSTDGPSDHGPTVVPEPPSGSPASPETPETPATPESPEKT